MLECAFLDLLVSLRTNHKQVLFQNQSKIFILNHCRGTKNLFLATDGHDNENVEFENQEDASHLLDDCIFLYSTADGNPAIRDKSYGSNVIQEHVKTFELNDLSELNTSSFLKRLLPKFLMAVVTQKICRAYFSSFVNNLMENCFQQKKMVTFL